MTDQQYPRSPKVLLGGIAHPRGSSTRSACAMRARSRTTITSLTGFDKHLIDFLEIDPGQVCGAGVGGKDGRGIVGVGATPWTASHRMKRSGNGLPDS